MVHVRETRRARLQFNAGNKVHALAAVEVGRHRVILTGGEGAKFNTPVGRRQRFAHLVQVHGEVAVASVLCAVGVESVGGDPVVPLVPVNGHVAGHKDGTVGNRVAVVHEVGSSNVFACGNTGETVGAVA